MRTVIGVLALFAAPAQFALAGPDLALDKSVNNALPTSGEPVEFTIDVVNVGDEAATEVVVVDRLPAGMEIPAGTAAFPGTGSYDPDSGAWTIGTLEPGAGAVLTIPALVNTAAPPDCIVNAAVTSHPGDDNAANDRALAAVYQATNVRCVDLDVSFGISFTTELRIFPECDAWDRYSGDVDVTNHGPDAARNVVVTIADMPVIGPNLRFDDADCSNEPSARCTIAQLAAGETVTIDVTSDLYQRYEPFTQTLTVGATTSDADYDRDNDMPTAHGSGSGFSSCEVPDYGLPDFVGIGAPACFIATAAYGTPLDPHLDSLRSFRDRVLLTNRPGRAFVRLYYRHSPPLAAFIAERDWLRALVRAILAPLVFAIEFPAATAFALLALLGLCRRRKRFSGARAAAHRGQKKPRRSGVHFGSFRD